MARAGRTGLADPDALRARFSAALSAMYRREVPLYGTLIELVSAVNGRASGGHATDGHAGGGIDPRLEVERHGAIRLGTPDELRLVRRLFELMGMRAVGYYDLAAAGVPVHSTAFRPVDAEAFERSPFRVFTSLLRPELIADLSLREEAGAILARRRIGSDALHAILERTDREGGVPEADAEGFVAAATEVFRWHETAPVQLDLYRCMREQHPLVADVVCFRGPHLNHLTPRTLDIDAAQAAMRDAGMTPKATIEGPPRRAVPILLRQTSFQALSETVRFGDGAEGAHTARFGEIEARGAALTPDGRALYDRLLEEVEAAVAAGERRGGAMARAFAAFPDDQGELRERELAFFDGRTGRPVVYEDFLPVSAAGIFRSNLGGDATKGAGMAAGTRSAFEAALGATVLDEMALYARDAGR